MASFVCHFTGTNLNISSGTFFGAWKATGLEFLNDTLTELDDLLRNRLIVNNIHVSIRLRYIIRDVPARAMVKGTKLYAGYFGY